MAQQLKACPPPPDRSGSVTSIRILGLSLSFLICKMDSNTICLIGLLGILCDIVHEYHLAKDLDPNVYLMDEDLTTTKK